MDHRRFDAIARALGGGMTRRGALAAALVALPVASALAQDDDPAAGKKKRKRCRKDSPAGQCCTDAKGCRCLDGGVACGPECCGVGVACVEGACVAGGCGWSSSMRAWNGRLLRGITADLPQRNLFVGAEFEGRVAWGTRPEDSDEWTWRLWIAQGATEAQRNHRVSGLAEYAGVQLYIADEKKQRVAVWTRPSHTSETWSFAAEFGGACCSEDPMKAPTAIALTADALTAFVTETGSVSIYRRTAADRQDWAFVKRLKGDSTSCAVVSFHRPMGVALAAEDLALIVTDCDYAKVWTRPNATSDAWAPMVALGSFGDGNLLQQPFGVSVGAAWDRSFWVADSGGSRLVEWVATSPTLDRWAVRTILGSRGSGPGQFMQPLDLHVSGQGTIRVIDIEDGGENRRTIETWSSCRSA